jgi:dihydrofolate reductase
MGRIVISEFISLDGVIEDPGGAEGYRHGGWTFAYTTGPDGDRFKLDKTLGAADWTNSTVLRGDVAEQVAELKQRLDGEILVAGSAQLARALVEHDLVDELRLMVFPVVLGTGKRLFGDTSDKKPMRLARSQALGDGVSLLVYEAIR